jgi:hypothetical protein
MVPFLSASPGVQRTLYLLLKIVPRGTGVSREGLI